MQRYKNQVLLALGNVDGQKVRIGLGLLAIVLFVLGAGAPGDSGSY